MTIFADMITLDDIRKPVTAELEALDEFVDRQFTAEGELLSDMLRYALSARGKGIRPMLVMLSAPMTPKAAQSSTACAFTIPRPVITGRKSAAGFWRPNAAKFLKDSFATSAERFNDWH